MRRQRARMSCSVLFRACPMCSRPVMLGGGMTMQYGGRGESGRAVKTPSPSKCSYQRVSIVPGSKFRANSIVIPGKGATAEVGRATKKAGHRPTSSGTEPGAVDGRSVLSFFEVLDPAPHQRLRHARHDFP